jgi:hypothetical protein
VLPSVPRSVIVPLCTNNAWPPEPPTTAPTEIPQVGHGIGGLGRCRRGWRDGDETGDTPPAEG